MKSQLTQAMLFDVLPVLVFAAKNGLNPDLRPTIAETHGALLTQPKILRCVSGCTAEILETLDKFGDETPTCQNFADTIGVYLMPLIVAASLGEKGLEDLTPELTKQIMEEPNSEEIFSRFISLLWIRAYPGTPGPDGRILYWEDLEKEAHAILSAEDQVAKLKANLFNGEFKA